MSISSPPNYGSPDWQRGVYSAQKLLATVAGGTRTASVTVPPNAETIVVSIPGGAGAYRLSLQGQTSLTEYPGIQAIQQTNIPITPMWFFDVSQCLDPIVEVIFTIAPATTWYVYADAGIHLTADITKIANASGIEYVIPTLPDTAGSDHPATELQLINATFAANGVLLASPGGGKRYRVFAWQIASQGAAVTGYLTDSLTNLGFAFGGLNIGSALTLPAQGFPLSTNAAVNFNLWGGAGNISVVLYYTTETV